MSISVNLFSFENVSPLKAAGSSGYDATSGLLSHPSADARFSSYEKESQEDKSFTIWGLFPLAGFFSAISGRDKWNIRERQVLEGYLANALSAPAPESYFYKLQYVMQLLNIADDAMGRAIILKNRGDKRASRIFSRIAGFVARGGDEIVSSYGELEEIRVNAGSKPKNIADWSLRMLDVKIRWLVFLSNVTTEKYFYNEAKAAMLHLFDRLASSSNQDDKTLLKLYVYFAHASFAPAVLQKFVENADVLPAFAKDGGVLISTPIPELLPYKSDTFSPSLLAPSEHVALIRAALVHDSVKFNREMLHLRRGMNEVARTMLERMKRK